MISESIHKSLNKNIKRLITIEGKILLDFYENKLTKGKRGNIYDSYQFSLPKI